MEASVSNVTKPKPRCSRLLFLSARGSVGRKFHMADFFSLCAELLAQNRHSAGPVLWL
jgi:hypothetical protein